MQIKTRKLKTIKLIYNHFLKKTWMRWYNANKIFGILISHGLQRTSKLVKDITHYSNYFHYQIQFSFFFLLHLLPNCTFSNRHVISKLKGDTFSSSCFVRIRGVLVGITMTYANGCNKMAELGAAKFMSRLWYWLRLPENVCPRYFNHLFSIHIIF